MNDLIWVMLFIYGILLLVVFGSLKNRINKIEERVSDIKEFDIYNIHQEMKGELPRTGYYER